MIAHRILSAFITVFLIAPLFIALMLLKAVWGIANSLNYKVFWNEVMIPEPVTQYDTNPVYAVWIRFVVIIISHIQTLFGDLKQLKNLQF
jgi:cytochrome c oxidase assembly factor CtaG